MTSDVENAASNVNTANGTYQFTTESPSLTLAAPTRVGYDFDGWTAVNTSGGGLQITALQSATPTVVFGPDATWGNVTLTPTWKRGTSNAITLAPDCNVSELKNTPTSRVYFWKGQGYTPTQSSDPVVAGQKLVETLPERSGYTFRGYYTGRNGEGIQCTDAEGNLVVEQELANSVWYAAYDKKGYSRVELDYNTKDLINDVSNTNATSAVYYWSERGYLTSQDTSNIIGVGKKLVNIPVVNGYEFQGYYLDDTMMVDKEGNLTQEGSDTVVAEDSKTTWTARWTLQNYTISYILDGGVNNSANPTSYNIETRDFFIQDPTRTNYNFAGWTVKGGSNEPVFNPSFTQGKSTGNITFIATWATTPVPGKIIYDMNDEGGNEAAWPSDSLAPAETFINTEPCTIRVPEPAVRPGYKFVQWSVIADNDKAVRINGTDGSATIYITEETRSNISLRASWEAAKRQHPDNLERQLGHVRQPVRHQASYPDHGGSGIQREADHGRRGHPHGQRQSAARATTC